VARVPPAVLLAVRGPVLSRPEVGAHHGPVFLGEDLLAWLVLAVGAAMAVGNALALVRPPEQRRHDDDLTQAPVGRAVVYIVIGVVAAIWGLATLAT